MSHGQLGIIRTQNLAIFIIALFYCLSTPCYALDVPFAWDATNSATGYKIYYDTYSATSGPPYNGTGAEEGPSPIDVNNQTQFTLHNLSDGGFRVAVTAYNDYGESGYSTEVALPPTQYLPSVVARLPFTEDFESGDLAECWKIHSTGTGRILVVTSNDPLSESYHLTMDSSQNGTYSLNELILTIDLSGQSGVILGFRHKEFTDEDHIMPDRFSGNHNSDGVAISADGTTWYKVQGLTSEDGISSGGTFYAVDLDSAVTAWGIDYNSTFKIKFQHYDNYPIGDDGFAFDDVAVYQIIADADHDGLPDIWELSHFDNLTQEPDDDWDYDGLNNLLENQLGTDPCDSDSDADVMLDEWEVRYGLDPTDAADADEDLDGDGQTNLEEHVAGTDPTLVDTDDDGINDWTDYRVTLNMRSEDDDAIGIMFRVQDSQNYYRFSWDIQRSYRRLVKVVNGRFTLLDGDAVPYVSGRTYQMKIIVDNTTLEVWIDQSLIFSAVDSDIAEGTIAFYSWGNQGSYFDDVQVNGLATGKVLLLEDFNNGLMTDWNVVDEGDGNAPSGWSAATGSLIQSSNIYSLPGDPANLPKLGTYARYSAPAQQDSDGDGISDQDEVSVYGTDPTLADTDDDGALDGYEVYQGTDPLDESSVPTINGDASGSYQLLVSPSSSRSNAVPLDSKVVSGDIYVFTSPDSGAERVTFYLDGSYHRTENFLPYDFAGSASSALAYPFDTHTLNDGQHEIRAVIDLANGGAEEVTKAFTVNN